MSFATGDILYNQYNFDPVVFAWNMDPEVRPGRSPYEVFRYNPVLNIDPLGNIDGNYYNSKGDLVASDDSPDDEKVYLVTNNKEARKLKKSDDVIIKGSVESAMELPEASIRKELVEGITKRDGENSYKEYGGFFGKNTDGSTKVLWAKPGEPYKAGSGAHIQPLDVSAESNPNGIGWNRLLDVITGVFHSHPTAEYNEGISLMDEAPGATTRSSSNLEGYGILQTPSAGDYDYAKNETVQKYVHGPHYMMSVKENKVHIYNKDGTIGTFPLDKFGSVK